MCTLTQACWPLDLKRAAGEGAANPPRCVCRRRSTAAQEGLRAALQLRHVAASWAAPAVAPPHEQQLAQQQQQQQQAGPGRDSVLRSAVKGLSWRFFGGAITIALAFFCLGGAGSSGARQAGAGMGWREMLRFGALDFICKYV